jgi:DNA-binding Xre family transcriptional regulator
MKAVRSQLLTLLAIKEQGQGKRISLKQVAREAGLKPYTVYGFANNTLKEYPADAIAKLCGYLSCEVGDLLKLEEVSV